MIGLEEGRSNILTTVQSLRQEKQLMSHQVFTFEGKGVHIMF